MEQQRESWWCSSALPEPAVVWASGRRERFEEALDAGLMQRCPGCMMKGQKDEACTHMYCPGCQETW
jgi:hypothetical protein